MVRWDPDVSVNPENVQPVDLLNIINKMLLEFKTISVK